MDKIPNYLSIGSRIRQLRDTVKLNQTRFAETIGISQTFLSDLEKGITKPTGPILLAIEYKYGVYKEWVLTGDEPKHIEPRGFPTVITKSSIKDHTPEYVGFQKVGVYAMAGAGTPNTHIRDEQIDEIIIPSTWNKPSIIPIKVQGTSMEETIMEGAYVGVDREDKFIVSGKIYAVWLPHEGAVIKRIYLDMEKITLKSDNPSFPDIFVPLAGLSDHFIQGRVTWVIQKL